MKYRLSWIYWIAAFYRTACQSLEGCSVTVNGGIQFGNYNPLSKEDKNAHGYVTVICDRNVTGYKILEPSQ